MRVKKYVSVLLVCLIIWYCVPIHFEAEAASSIPALPGVVTGMPATMPGDAVPGLYVNMDLSGYLSHYLDVSIEAARRWGGRLVNCLVDEDLCPEAYAQNINGGRHHFVYGLTNRDGVTGYYNYCEYCGLFSGDLLSEYVHNNMEDIDFSSDGVKIFGFPGFYNTGTYVSGGGGIINYNLFYYNEGYNNYSINKNLKGGGVNVIASFQGGANENLFGVSIQSAENKPVSA